MHIVLEVCVDTLDGALAAAAGGADRIELCAALEVGGLTPDTALLRAVRERVALPIVAMARPRAGRFVYTDAEHERMLDDASRLIEAGADGVVFGCLDGSGRVHRDRARAMVELAGGRDAVFHRAIDEAVDPVSQIDALIEAGVKRVLSSGGKATVEEGAHVIAAMIQRAAGRIELMPGAGLDAANVASILARTGAGQLHGSFSRIEGGRKVTDASRVAAARRAVDEFSGAARRSGR